MMFCTGEADSLGMVEQRTLAAQHQYVMNRAPNVAASAGGGNGGGELQLPGSIPAAEVFRVYSNGNSVSNCGGAMGVLPQHDNNCAGPQNPSPNPQNPSSNLQSPHFNRQSDFLNPESPQSKPCGNPQNPCSNPAETVKVERVFLYKECQRNHAVSIGGHALDGCGEFMASEEDPLKCAACNCHRNFHRRELEGEESERPCRFCKESNKSGGTGMGPYYPPLPVLPHTASSAHMLMGFSPGLGESDDADVNNNNRNPSNYHHRGMKKRFRTKFSQNQKEMMYMFADKIGWRMQKQDEAAVQQFCNEIGVSKGVLKVWMHNNKHTLGKKH